MKRSLDSVLLIAVLLLAGSPCLGAEAAEDWENPGVLGRNKEPAHCTLMPFASEKSALGDPPEASPYDLSLGGAWKFHWSATPDTRPEGFYAPDYDVSAWDRIPVPASNTTFVSVPRVISRHVVLPP